MADYKLELSDVTAHLDCSCCAKGMTSICGFVRRDSRPYAMYYAILHNNLIDQFVRLSVSMGAGWETTNLDERLALCMDLLPRGDDWAISVQDANDSPQESFVPFGHWLNREEAREHSALPEFLELTTFIMQHDPAVASYMARSEMSWVGRKQGNGEI